MAASAALCAWLGGWSLGWPLIHDAPVMHYIAWLIAQGAVPYRDAFDMNVPGVYLIHWGILASAGAGDLAWRLFDLAWLAATSGLLFAYGRGLGDRGTAAASAVLFALYHLSGGAWRVGQRDFLLCLFLLGGTWGVARSLEHDGALRPLVWAGLALGAGMMVKPPAGAYWLGCAAAAAWRAWREKRSVIAGVGTVLGAGLLVPALVFSWLAWRGGLGAFVAIYTGYVLPLYGHVGRVSVWEAFGWYRHGWLVWGLLGVLGLLAWLGRAPEGSSARRALALFGVGYGWLHFSLQGKGWEYHRYPLALFLCALAPLATRLASRGALPALHRAAAFVLLSALVVTLGDRGLDALDEPWIEAKARRVAAVSRDLAPLVPAGGTVQVMDVTEGGVHVLLRLGLRQPTRFLFDFHFFHDQADPRIKALQAEFVAGLVAGRPAAIVVMRETWNRPGYDRLREVPGLMPLLDRAYTLAAEGDDYRIYAKRARS